MLLKDLKWVIREFKFDKCSKTNISYYVNELIIYNDRVRIDIFRVYDQLGNPGEYIRIFEDPHKICDYKVFNFKEFISNPDKDLLDEIAKKQLLNEA